jgi:hypothetical protein
MVSDGVPTRGLDANVIVIVIVVAQALLRRAKNVSWSVANRLASLKNLL